MQSQAYEDFGHSIRDAEELLSHFDDLNTKPPPPEIEVLKRASLVMALAALESFFEDVLKESALALVANTDSNNRLERFFRESIEIDLKSFHTPKSDRVRQIFQKYLELDITQAWAWNGYTPEKSKEKLDELARQRGDIAHRSLRPATGKGQPPKHAVNRNSLKKHIKFIKGLVEATDCYIRNELGIVGNND